jgi:nickel superoxide dismutase
MRKLAMLAGLAALAAFARPVFAHCQVPCGIFTDTLRIHMMREDLATIEKAMRMIIEIGAAEKPDWNQLVRWVTTKEEHAEKIMDCVAAYFLAQRVKVPAADADGAALAAYHAQLSTLHRLTVAAMKTKQTTDQRFVTECRKLVDEFAALYFSPEDLKHLEEHE